MEEEKKRSQKQQRILESLISIINFRQSEQKYSFQVSKHQLNVNDLISRTDIKIQIKKNSLQGIDDSKFIGKSLKYLNQLLILNLKILEKNNFGCQGLISLSKSLSQLTQLKEFSLEIYKENNVGVNGINSFGKSLGSLSNLSKLVVTIISNPITSEGLQSIGKGIALMTDLKNFKMMLIDVQILFSDTYTFLMNISKIKFDEIELKIMIGEKQEDLKSIESSNEFSHLKTFSSFSELNISVSNNRLLIESHDKFIQKIRMLNKNNKIESDLLLQLDKFKVETISPSYLKIIQDQFQLRIIINEEYKKIGLINLAYSLSQFHSLKKLTLSISPKVNIDIEDANCIKEALSQLLNLHFLIINFLNNNNQMNIEKADLIIQGMEGLQNLYKFSLLLKGQAQYQFLGVLGFLKQLKSFNLNYYEKPLLYSRDSQTNDINKIKINNYMTNTIIDYQGYMHLIASFKYFSSLKELDLNFSNLNGNEITGAEKIKESFQYLYNLNQLILTFSSSIQQRILSKIIEGIQQVKLIQDFQIKFIQAYRSSKIDQQFTIDLFKMLGKQKLLKKLQIHFTDEMAKINFNQELADQMIRIKELDFLSVVFVQSLSFDGIYMMKQWFQLLTKLTTFHLQLEQLASDLTLLELVKSFQCLKSIQHLKINMKQSINVFLEQQLIVINLFRNLKSLNIHTIITINSIQFFKNLSSYLKELKVLEKLELSLEIKTNIKQTTLIDLKEGIQSVKGLKNVKMTINGFYITQQNTMDFQSVVINMKSLLTFSFYHQYYQQSSKYLSLIKRKNIRLVKYNYSS